MKRETSGIEEEHKNYLTPGSNGGPPLDDDPGHVPPWGRNGIGRYFEWRTAKKAAFDAPFDIARMRARRAAMIGLTYEEYVAEILERGRYLNAGDTERIAAIIARRGCGIEGHRRASPPGLTRGAFTLGFQESAVSSGQARA